MKTSAVCLIWLVLLGALVMGAAGCATSDPDNDSARPWNSPQGYENGMPIQNEQHAE